MRKYGWAFLLLMGVPFVGAVVNLAFQQVRASDLVSHDSILLPIALTSVATTALLGILYPQMRKANQPTLHLVWSGKLALAGIASLMYSAAVVVGYGENAVEFGLVVTAAGLPGLFLLLWFARQASRLSLAHAYFLVFVVGGVLPDLPDSLPLLLGWLWGLLSNVLAVWLLANFDLRGPGFRRWSVGIILGLKVLVLMPHLALGSGDTAYPLLFLLGTVFATLLPIALVYLVRVRRPDAQRLPESLSP